MSFAGALATGTGATHGAATPGDQQEPAWKEVPSPHALRYH